MWYGLPVDGLMSSGDSECLLLWSGGPAQYFGDRLTRSKFRRPVRLLPATLLPENSVHGRKTDGSPLCDEY